jgi:hypothetical protein
LAHRLGGRRDARGDRLTKNGSETQTNSTGKAKLATLLARETSLTESRIDELVDPEVKECEAGAHEGDAYARWNEPVPLT